MLRNTILLLFSGLLFQSPLMAQSDCCKQADKAACEQADKAACEKGDSCSDAATVATTVSQDAPSDLAKGLAAITSRPFSFDVALNAKGGEEQATTLKGHVAYADAKHFAVKMAIDVKMGEESQKVKVHLTCDGKYLYADMPSMMGGDGNQLVKVEYSVLEGAFQAGMKQSPLPVFNAKGAIDPAAIDKALKMAAAKITKDEKAGTVSLAIKQPGEDEGSATINIVLDSRTFLPKSLKMTEGKDKTVNADFSNVKIYKDVTGFGEGYFSFKAPEGAVIQDMTPMVQMMMAQMGGDEDGEEELEF